MKRTTKHTKRIVKRDLKKTKKITSEELFMDTIENTPAVSRQMDFKVGSMYVHEISKRAGNKDSTQDGWFVIIVTSHPLSNNMIIGTVVWTSCTIKLGGHYTWNLTDYPGFHELEGVKLLIR
jgi:hypothetical protein